MTNFADFRSIKGLKFCHLNVRSLLSKSEVFRLHFENSGLDVITISETWLSDSVGNNIMGLNNYKLLRSDRSFLNDQGTGVKKGGGLLMYIRQDLNFVFQHNVSSNLSTPDLELQRVELSSSVQKNIVVYNIYRPPSGNVQNCFDKINTFLEMEPDFQKKEFLILGDFNIDYSVKNSPDAKKIKSWQNKYGFMQKINRKTRSSKQSSTLLDLVFTNMDHVCDAGVSDLHISDHQPVFIVKKKQRDVRKEVNFIGRTYTNYSKELLSDCLSNAHKASFRNEDDPNRCWGLMENFLEGFLDKYCPKKTYSSKENTPAWISHDLIILSKDRDSAYERAKLTNSVQDWDHAKQLRNWVNNAVKAAKADYVKNELENNKSDAKKFWKNIKNVLPDQDTGGINIVNEVSKEALPLNDQAQVINEFFANIGLKLDRKFKTQAVEYVGGPEKGDDFNLVNIAPQEVLKLVNTISMYKSSGIDDISSRVIRDFMFLTVREFAHLFNLIISTGSFPDKWKIATVTPIPKVTNAIHPTDLRPISLLPIPGKLLEKYITEQTVAYLERKNFLKENQSGFRKGKSTAHSMTNFLDDIVTNLNCSETSIVAYLDFQKAFDTINHQLLLQKLQNAGLGIKLVDLIKNYLSNRKQKTKLNGSMSTLQAIHTGVPQGSIIGPLMFLIYINDLPDVLLHSKALMYADDTVLYCSNESGKEARKDMQNDLLKIQTWCELNRMTLNIKKTKFMTFMSDHKRKSYRPFKLYIRGLQIEEVNSYKYLGTILDNKLNGEPQFNSLLRNVGFKIRTFGRIRKFLTTRAALTVYKSTILPIIDYNDYFQLMWNREKIGKIQKQQNWGLRVVYSSAAPGLSEDEMHEMAKLPKLSLRRVTHLLHLMYLRSKLPNVLDDRDLPTRQFDKIKFKVINPIINKAFKTPNYLGAKMWDMLPFGTQNSNTITEFKRRVNIHVLTGLFNGI